MAEWSRQQPLLGTFVEITVSAGEAEAMAAMSAAFDAIQGLHESLSFQSPDSDLTRLNLAGGEWVKMPLHARRVLRLAKAMTVASKGLFNATVGGEMVSLGVLPDHGFQKPLLVGRAGDIEIRNTGARLNRGILVTLDGIAKGYAVDLAVAALRRNGIQGGVVNAGGDLRAFGSFQAPISVRKADGSVAPVGLLEKGAVATSTAAASSDGRFPGQIIGKSTLAKTARTAMAARAWRADALTKVACLVADDRHAAEAVARLGGCLVN